MEESHRGGKQKQAEKDVGVRGSCSTPTPCWAAGPLALGDLRGGSMAPRPSWRDSGMCRVGKGRGWLVWRDSGLGKAWEPSSIHSSLLVTDGGLLPAACFGG